jgi:sugar-specific transcriptional regulator TrmB
LTEDVIKQFLKDLGLTASEIDVYLFLMTRMGASKGTDVAKYTKKDKGQIYRILKSLQSKGLVEPTLEAPVRFAPVPFEKVVESVIKVKREDASRIENAKQELFDYWKKLGKTRFDEPLEKFLVIEGTNKIYSKIMQLLSQTKERFSIVTSVAGLRQAYQKGIFYEVKNHPSKEKIEFRYVTDISKNNIESVKTLLTPLAELGVNIKGRNPNVGLQLSPQMVIRDSEEALFFMSTETDASKQTEVCLWTNSSALVQAFVAVFEDLWRNSSEISKRITELQTGVTVSRRITYSSVNSAKRKFKELSCSAKKEIVLLTSADRLLELSKDKSFLNLAKNGVEVRIMAPINRHNFQESDPFFKLCNVRHIRANFCETTIIDGRCMLQVNADGAKNTEDATVACFVGAYYTEEPEHVREMKTSLNELWKIAQPLSFDTLENTVLFSSPIIPLSENNLLRKYSLGIYEIKPPGDLVEQDILNKILKSEKLVVNNLRTDISRMYASVGVALIHPPISFKLPPLLILAFHVDKSSSFGAEDYLVIYQQIKANSYWLPVTVVGDNPNSKEILKKAYTGTPAGNNHISINKDEIQIRVHGNTLFAAWAIEIPLYPASLVLPPACMQIEGYGNLKTVGYRTTAPSGFKHEVEQNYFDAYVTFFHPSTKYSGPGTDAIFCRDYISTNYPPKVKIDSAMNKS